MKLTKRNYYSKEANEQYVSYSQLKTFSECEAKCIAELNGEFCREETTALLVGSYVDAYLDGANAFGKFKVENPALFKRDGTLKSDFVQAEEIIARIESDKVFRSYLKGVRQKIMTCVIMGVPVKIKIDSYHKNRMIVDGKIMKDCDDVWSDKDGSYVPFWRAYRYDWQAYLYTEAVYQNTGLRLPFVLAVATKQKGIDVRVFKFSDDTIRNAGIEVGNIIQRLQLVKQAKGEPFAIDENGHIFDTKPKRCCNCEYCRSKRVIKPNEFEII